MAGPAKQSVSVVPNGIGLILVSVPLIMMFTGMALGFSALRDIRFVLQNKAWVLLTATTLTPALPFAAFDGEKAVWTPMRTIAFNLTGQPALSLPAGFENGLPLGLQLISRHGDEDLLCMAGHAFERATDHSVQRPSL